MRSNPEVNAVVMDIEDLGNLGEKYNLCPYYLSRDMAATADIIFMPYNYLVDPKTRGGLGISWDNAVLIFDEAHNVEVRQFGTCIAAGSLGCYFFAYGSCVDAQHPCTCASVHLLFLATDNLDFHA